MPANGKKGQNAREAYRYRFGIGEWYGKLFTKLTPDEREQYAQIQKMPSKQRPVLACPFRSAEQKFVKCSKNSGVCSIRQYRQESKSGEVSVALAAPGALTATCPHRVKEVEAIYAWVGDMILNDSNPAVLGEVGFLESVTITESDEESEDAAEVGMIDNVLISPTAAPLKWCALEIQTVYFSGDNMGLEFDALLAKPAKLPFPVGDRHPDYRSCGPKRLIPQLQTKVPALRRWGKKMAVVVDENFFNSLGRMDDVADLSNADIAWFVVRFTEKGGHSVLEPGFVRFTTLERAVEGLTGGLPVSLSTFEERILAKLDKATKKKAKQDKKHS